MREVEQQTRGRVRLGPGTLYGSLRTLLEAGLIEELEDVSEDGSVERRRYYRLTSSGLKLVRAEVEGLAHTLRVARAKRRLRSLHV